MVYYYKSNRLKGACEYYEELYKSKHTEGNTKEGGNDNIFKDANNYLRSKVKY